MQNTSWSCDDINPLLFIQTIWINLHAWNLQILKEKNILFFLVSSVYSVILHFFFQFCTMIDIKNQEFINSFQNIHIMAYVMNVIIHSFYYFKNNINKWSYSLYSLLSKFDMLSKENGGIRQSKFIPSSRSIRKVPHMWPDGACKLICEEYWKAGAREFNIGSCPTTPLPRTVSNVPDKANILQCLSRSWTLNWPRFSNRIL